jgi:hypothetical protein
VINNLHLAKVMERGGGRMGATQYYAGTAKCRSPINMLQAKMDIDLIGKITGPLRSKN